jgi:hypothetical protein
MGWTVSSGWIVVGEKHAAGSWDGWASQMPSSSPFQSFAVGQYYKRIGCDPLFCVCFGPDGRVLAMALCTVKARFWNTVILACIGGPSGDPAQWANLPDAVRRHLGLKWVYLRFRCDQGSCERAQSVIESTGWRRVPVASGSGLTMMIDLARSLDEVRAGLSRTWRQHLNAAHRHDLTIETNAALDPRELDRIFGEMVAVKQFASTIDEWKIRALLDRKGANILFASARNARGAVLAFRCTMVLGSQAVDFIAASSPEGRQTRASYAVFWHQLAMLQQLGVKDFDLGGIDPEGNPGVYRFKVRTGGVRRALMGEYEMANAGFLLDLVNYALQARELKFRLSRWPDLAPAPAGLAT